jgi:hypothetical protein
MNNIRTGFSVLATLVVISANAQQNNCTTLIQYGLRDEIQSMAQSNSYQQSVNQLCRDFSTYQSDKKSGNVKATYGAFDGSAGFSAERYEALSDALCTNNTNIANLTSATQLTNKILNPAALEALKQCEQLNAFGLKVTTETAPNDERIAISFLLSVVPGTTGKIVVEAPVTESDVTCTGPIPPITDKLLPPNQSVTYVCSRKAESKPFEYRGQRLYAKASMITIPTSSGAIIRNIPTIYADRLPPSELENKLKALTLAASPVGTVISSYLTFDEMKKIDPEFQNYWQPADGRIVNRSTAYFKAKTDQSLNPVKLPDLRGVFIRGLNTFDTAAGLPPAPTSQLDPETRSLGHFQADDFKSHTHPITNNSPAFAYQVSGMGIQSNRGQEVRFTPPAISIGAAGGAETRPKNIAVNYFIRVN